jgi:hypothetical protein
MVGIRNREKHSPHCWDVIEMEEEARFPISPSKAFSQELTSSY